MGHNIKCFARVQAGRDEYLSFPFCFCDCLCDDEAGHARRSSSWETALKPALQMSCSMPDHAHIISKIFPMSGAIVIPLWLSCMRASLSFLGIASLYEVLRISGTHLLLKTSCIMWHRICILFVDRSFNCSAVMPFISGAYLIRSVLMASVTISVVMMTEDGSMLAKILMHL